MPPRSAFDWMLLPLKRYAQFGGRAPRAEFWWFTPLLVAAALLGGTLLLALLVPGFAVTVRRLHDVDRSGWWALVPLAGLVVPVVLLLGVMGVFGPLPPGMPDEVFAEGDGVILFWAAMAALGAANLLLQFWCAQPGTPGINRFGEDPAGEDGGPPFYY